MKYILLTGAAYLILGVVLTRSILGRPTLRLRFRDIVVGAVAMPVLFALLVVFELREEVWKRLLIILDFDAPEEMRAGPREAVGRDADKI